MNGHISRVSADTDAGLEDLRDPIKQLLKALIVSTGAKHMLAVSPGRKNKD